MGRKESNQKQNKKNPWNPDMPEILFTWALTQSIKLKDKKIHTKFANVDLCLNPFILIEQDKKSDDNDKDA